MTENFAGCGFIAGGCEKLNNTRAKIGASQQEIKYDRQKQERYNNV